MILNKIIIMRLNKTDSKTCTGKYLIDELSIHNDLKKDTLFL